MPTPLLDIVTYTGSQTDAVVRAAAGGRRLLVSMVEILVSKACTVNVDALIEFDAGTDVKIKKFNAIPPGGGVAVPIWALGGDGEDVVATVTAPTGGDVTIGVNSIDLEV